MINPARFLFSLFLVASSYLLVAITPARAQSPAVTGDSHYYAQQVFLDLSSALTCQLVGIDPSGPDPQTGEPKRCLAYDVTGKLGFVPNPAPNGAGQVGGAVGTMGNLIAVLYTPPASTGDYFRYLADNFGLVKPAYAQGGTGFQGLTPLLPVWTVFRNLAYVLFILAFVITGLAVMLRVRLDPRTVMTIQNQIPKLIIGLLLVTFSYAIAGFLIDFMYVTIYLFFGLAQSISGLPPETIGKIRDVQQGFQGDNPLGVFNNLLGFWPLTSTVANSITGLLGNFFGLAPLAGIRNFSVVGINIGGLFGVIFGAIPFLIISIAVLWALFRLWFALIQAYVFILIDVVFAPLWILSGILPGGLGVGAWLRDIAANLSAFPTTVAMFLLGKIFMDGFKTTGSRFVPPLIGNPGATELIGSLIGLGIILMTPQVVNMVRDFFKAPKFNLAPIGQAIGVGAGVPTGTVRTTAGILTAGYTDITGARQTQFGWGRVLQRLFR